MRIRGLAALLAASCALVASSAPDEEEPYEVFSSFPGPDFFLSQNRTIVDFLITVQATPECFPPEGDWVELFEVEADFEEDGDDTDERRVLGRLARVTPDGRSVLTSTVTRISVPDRGTLIVADEKGITECVNGTCQKQYVVRFVMNGRGILRPFWFIRAGFDWARNDLEVPEAARIVFRAQLL